MSDEIIGALIAGAFSLACIIVQHRLAQARTVVDGAAVRHTAPGRPAATASNNPPAPAAPAGSASLILAIGVGLFALMLAPAAGDASFAVLALAVMIVIARQVGRHGRFKWMALELAAFWSAVAGAAGVIRYRPALGDYDLVTVIAFALSGFVVSLAVGAVARAVAGALR